MNIIYKPEGYYGLIGGLNGDIKIIDFETNSFLNECAPHNGPITEILIF